MIKESGLPGVHYIQDNLLKDIEKFYPMRICLAESELIYQGHVPTAAYIICEGNVRLSKRRDVVSLLPGAILGARELHKNKIFRFTARVSKGGKVIILDRSSMQEILEHHHDPIKKSFKLVLE